MSRSNPTYQQVDLLRAIDQGQVTSSVEDKGDGSGRTTDRLGRRDVSRRIDSLVNNRWATYVEGRLALTRFGHAALALHEAYEQVTELGWDHPLARSVRITNRSRGLHPISRRPSAPGRDLGCAVCYDKARASFESGATRQRPTRVVWFTNEGGAPAQRDAEEHRVLHIVQHLADRDWEGVVA